MSEKPVDYEGVRDQRAHVALRNAMHCVAALHEARTGERVEALRLLKRAVQVLVDQVQRNGAALLQQRAHEVTTAGLAAHSVRVGVLAAGMGHQLGLSRQALYELTSSAVLHDIGKTRLAPEIVDKPGALNADEWKQMQRHPQEGLLWLLAAPRDARAAWRPLLAAYEHHLKVDHSGYPQVRRPRKMSLFSRIIAVADVFDAVTSPRSYRSRPWPQDTVLRNMLEQPQWGLDRAVVKLLICVVGLYARGSLLQLGDGSLSVVTHNDPQYGHAPRVRVVTDAQGRIDRQGPEVETRDADVTIARSVGLHELPADVAAALAGTR